MDLIKKKKNKFGLTGIKQMYQRKDYIRETLLDVKKRMKDNVLRPNKYKDPTLQGP